MTNDKSIKEDSTSHYSMNKVIVTGLCTVGCLAFGAWAGLGVGSLVAAKGLGFGGLSSMGSSLGLSATGAHASILEGSSAIGAVFAAYQAGLLPQLNIGKNMASIIRGLNAKDTPSEVAEVEEEFAEEDKVAEGDLSPNMIDLKPEEGEGEEEEEVEEEGKNTWAMGRREPRIDWDALTRLGAEEMEQFISKHPDITKQGLLDMIETELFGSKPDRTR